MQWKIDTDHSAVEFAVRHMMVTTVRGQVKDVTGTIEFDPAHPENTTVEANIGIATIHTGVTDRDTHLRSADFFNVEKYPVITFKSTAFKSTGENEGVLSGDLTIVGVTRPVNLDVKYLGQGLSPFGDQRVGFEAETKINREEFGLVWNMALESGGSLVSRDARVILDIQAILVTENTTA
jgi:polyisoprenoid-binding protein YceI